MRASMAWPVIATCSCASAGVLRSDLELPLDEVQACDHLVSGCSTCSRVFISMTIEIACLVDDELDGTALT
jgi:hypothetical protein